MEQIVDYIKSIITIYKKNEDKYNLILKFIAGLFIFGRLGVLANGSLGGAKVLFLTVVCAVLTLIVSPSIFVVMMGLLSCLYIATVSLETAIIVFALFFVIFVFYVRIFPKESLIIPAMLIAYMLKIPYIVPVFAGLYVGVKGLGAIAIAVFLHSADGLLGEMMALIPKTEFDLMGMLDNFIKLLEIIAVKFTISWIYVAAVFVLSALCASVISKLSIQYERLIAIAVSGIVMLIGIFTAPLMGAEVSIIGAIIGVAISCVTAYLFNFLDFVLDYGRTEHVRFQDDNYMYYVKAVPKIKR